MGDPTRVVGRRVIAYLLDAVILTLVFFGVAAALGVEVRSDPVNPSGWNVEGSDAALAMTAILPVLYFALVNVVLQGLTGATPGRAMVGIRLVGWDGNPPGIWRAFVHSIFVQLVAGLFLPGGLILFLFVSFNKAHRHPGNMITNTYVVDSPAVGHVMVRTAAGVRAGPPAIRREDVIAELGPEVAAKILAPTVQSRSTEPQFDKQRGTYVVWNAKTERWLEFDDKTRQWNELR